MTWAVKWYRRAADQGSTGAQSNLAAKYYLGQGVPQDYVQAHMWSNLSAVQGHEDAKKCRDLLVEKMTSAQIAEAQRLAAKWKPKSHD
jgi:TPR repeat protein